MYLEFGATVAAFQDYKIMLLGRVISERASGSMSVAAFHG